MVLIRENDLAEFFYFLYHGRVVATQQVDADSGETEVSQRSKSTRVSTSEQDRIKTSSHPRRRLGSRHDKAGISPLTQSFSPPLTRRSS